MEGYIILHKKLLEWQYYQNPNMVLLFIHLLLIANEEGNVNTTLKELERDTGLSIKVIRNCLAKLEKGMILGTKRAQKNTYLTICNFEDYKETKIKKGTKKGTILGTKNESSSPTNPQANLDKRRDTFTEQLRPYVQIYGRDMVNDFWKYWTEPNKSKTRMRFELEKTWDLNLRMQRWASNNKMEKNGTNRPNTETKEQRAEKYARRIEELLAEDEGQATGEDDTK